MIDATEFEQEVGRRIREARVYLGISQGELGRMIGVSSQQIQKYEKGENRISAGRLFALARCLDLPVGYFYANLENAEGHPDDELPNKVIRMARTLDELPEGPLKDHLFRLIKEIAKQSGLKPPMHAAEPLPSRKAPVRGPSR